METKYKLPRISVWILLGCLGWVHSSANSDVLTWDDCVALASKNNPALQAANENLLSAQESSRGSRSGFFPQASGSLGYTHANSTTVSGGGLVTGSVTNTSDSYSATLNLSQNLFNGWSDRARVNQAQANEGVVQAALQTARAQVSYNLKVAFETLAVSLKSISLSEAITARRAQNLSLVELRFKDGRENRGSALLYQAYLKDAKYGELQSRDNLIEARAQLAQALGLDHYQDLKISGEIPLHSPTEPDLGQSVLETPNYFQAFYQEKSADAGITLARAGFFPTLGLSGLLGKSGSSWFPEDQRWSVGLTLTVPLFNGGRDYYATRAALDSEKAAMQSLHNVIFQGLSLLETARTNYVEAVAKLDVDQSYLEAARARSEIARANYKNGLLSFQDWDLAETDLINREKNLLQSEQNRVVAEAAWEQAQGKGVLR